MGVLEDVGILDGGKLSESCKNGFIEEVKGLLVAGNPEDKPFWFVPIPPFFPPDPLAAIAGPPPLENEEMFPIWHKIFIETLMEGTAKALDVKDATPLAGQAIIDPCALALKLGLDVPDLDLNATLGLFPPTPDILFEVLGIDLLDVTLVAELTAKLPELVVPPLPSIPIPPIPSLDAFIPVPSFSVDIPFPSLPTVPLPEFPAIPSFTIPSFPSITLIIPCIITTALAAIFAQLIAKALQGDLVASFTKGPIGIIEFVAVVVIAVILNCVGDFPIGALTSFLAGIIVYIKNVVVMFIIVIISQILGSGCLTAGMADFLGC